MWAKESGFLATIMVVKWRGKNNYVTEIPDSLLQPVEQGQPECDGAGY